MDQCKHCMVRGNIDDCLSVPCFQRENWYSEYQAEEIERLRGENARYRAALEAIDNEDTYSAAVLYSIAAEALKEQDNG